ncbi:MAG TPA: P-type conjugative transfer protein TrbG [Polyangiaceae bacterium]|nr:P-type conjugative transfer protein TrbG [Polyangiaceae bacterium]
MSPARPGRLPLSEFSRNRACIEPDGCLTMFAAEPRSEGPAPSHRPARHALRALIIVVGAAHAACAHDVRPIAAASAYVRAQPAPEVAPPELRGDDDAAAEPAPGQLKLMPPRSAGAMAGRIVSPQQLVMDANRKASQAPDSRDYFNAIVQYAFEPGTLYQVFAAPTRITDLVLQPGEKILGQPASGDVVRWILALGRSLDRGVEQWHVYLKPTRPELQTNLAINTDRRTYLLELHSYPDTYMAAVMWHYPQDEMARLQAQAADATRQERTSASLVSLDALNFGYSIQAIRGSPAWTPLQVFDDGRRTFIRFPSAMRVREAPALFVLRDDQTQLVNYRMKGDFYVVDRLVDSVELRVGQQDQEIVRVDRTAPSRR